MVTIDDYLRGVSGACGIPISEILGRRRTREVALVRQIVMYLLRKHTKLSFPRIGVALRRDHSSMIYGCKAIAARIDRDSAFAEKIQKIEREIHAN